MLEVAPFKMSITHADAKLYLFSLGNGWRLPTITECKRLHRKKLMNNFIVWIAETEETEQLMSQFEAAGVMSDGNCLPSYEFDFGMWGGYNIVDDDARVGLLPVRDTTKRQMWKRNQFSMPLEFEVAPEEYELRCGYGEAVQHCSSLEINGKSDWRLPTNTELYKLSVLDYAKHGIFGHYWSVDGEYCVFTKNGFYINPSSKLSGYTRVRPVRDC